MALGAAARLRDETRQRNKPNKLVAIGRGRITVVGTRLLYHTPRHVLSRAHAKRTQYISTIGERMTESATVSSNLDSMNYQESVHPMHSHPQLYRHNERTFEVRVGRVKSRLTFQENPFHLAIIVGKVVIVNGPHNEPLNTFTHTRNVSLKKFLKSDA